MFANLNHLSHHAAWRRQLEMLLESTGEGIYGIDQRGRCIFINRAGAELIGFEPDEVLGRNMHYLIHHAHSDGRNYDVHDCPIFKAFLEGKGVRSESEVLWRRDGTPFPAEYTSYPIRDAGQIVGAVVTFADITERKRAEAVLRANQIELERRVSERTAALQDANARLQQSQSALRRLSAHLQEVREEERTHIAREVHDELGASLTALQFDLNWLRPRLADDEALNRKLDDMMTVTGQALGAVRRILTDLRPGVLDHLGLWAALEWLLQETQTRSGLRGTLVSTEGGGERRLGRSAEIAVYRIVQEVLTNVVRHAQASEVIVTIGGSPSGLELDIRDDGIGMRVPAQPTSFGLLGMYERARALGGELSIESTPGKGTSVRLRVPESTR
ncbi:sensor histidine kinase [Methyloversatilis thermotolerans]|uniref:sensor histidine kinase n=1 Tax=Methyloversatilis thermotolerans TaxID=1346290 RepID=UPI0003717489|nr:PAS domain-containing sensor histidine kinase [Methyloversatilis thermotolerans]